VSDVRSSQGETIQLEALNMRIRPFVVVSAMVGVLMGSGALLAHHGGNLYDTTKAVVLKGTITKFEWGTPHNQIFFDAKNDKGEVQHWVASTEPAPVMLERGWTRRSLKEGDEVTVYIYAAKNGATVGNLQKIVLADGKELTAAGPAGRTGL
jgi:hypothetical protein